MEEEAEETIATCPLNDDFIMIPLLVPINQQNPVAHLLGKEESSKWSVHPLSDPLHNNTEGETR